MKRNMDLIRDLLFAIESKIDSAGIWSENFEIEQDWSRDDIRNHLVLIAEAGFIRHEANRSSSTPSRLYDVMVFDLTWEGHEYLDTIRDPEIWKQTKKGVSKIGGASFETIVAIARSLGKGVLHDMGIPII